MKAKSLSIAAGSRSTCAQSHLVFALVCACAFSNGAHGRTVAVDRSIAVDRTIAVDGQPILDVRDPQETDTSPTRDFITRFAGSGQAYANTTIVPLAPDAVLEALMPFKLNFGDGVHFYMSCVSENGFMWLLAVGGDKHCPSRLSFSQTVPASDVLFADYADLASHRDAPDELDGTIDFATGVADWSAPYQIDSAKSAATVVWYEVPYVGYPGVTSQQILFIDEGDGDFDIEFNWQDTPVTHGLHGFSLGRWSYVVRNVTGSTQSRFCFRRGIARGC